MDLKHHFTNTNASLVLQTNWTVREKLELNLLKALLFSQ